MKSWQVLLDFANELLTQDTRPEFSPGVVKFPRGRLKNVGDQFSRPLRDWTHLLILPRTDVLGYIHAVPSGLHRPPGEISGLAAMVFGECFRCCPCGASLQSPVDRA
jgi:hypothetical protein